MPRLIVAFFLLYTASVAAAEYPEGFLANESPKRGFFSTENILLTGGVVLTGVGDVASTFACIHVRTIDPATGRYVMCVEGNTLSKPFVDRGPLTASIEKAVLVGMATVPAYFLRRSHHVGWRVVGYAVPIAMIVVQGYATIHNIRNRNFILSFKFSMR